MEGGGGVHSKFIHILVYEFVSSRENTLTLYVLPHFDSWKNKRLSIHGTMQCPPEYGTASSVVTDDLSESLETYLFFIGFNPYLTHK